METAPKPGGAAVAPGAAGAGGGTPRGAAMHEHLQRARSAIEGATAHLTVELIGRAFPGKWSVAEILEHLTLTFTTNADALAKALASGEPRAARPTLLQFLGRVLVIDLGVFPRANAPAAVTPRGSIPPERAREAIAAALVRVDAALELAAARFGERTPLLRHAYFAGLTVRQWRRFHWRHTRHHMRQVRARIGAAPE